MVTLKSLLKKDPVVGLWHGTRSDIEDQICSGESVLDNPRELISEIWKSICAQKNISYQSLESDHVTYFFSAPASLQHAADIGNSIRYLNDVFEYDVTAFATTKFSAIAFAEIGSELARAICALVDAAWLEYSSIFSSSASDADSVKIKKMYAHAQKILAGKPTLYRLISLPVDGQFFLPGEPEKSIDHFAVPFAGYPIPPEVFFRGVIPGNCWEKIAVNTQ